jgi:hypothetical protein
MSVQATTVLASSARTTSGNSTTVTVPDWSPADPRSVSVYQNVTAQSGTTPTLDMQVQWSPDGTTWYSASDTFTQVAAATGTAVKQFAVKAPYWRLSYTIAGTTPSYTFDVKAVYQA